MTHSEAQALAEGPPLVTVHSLVMDMAGDVAVANHKAYAERLGFAHRVHRLSCGGETDRTRLLRKYSAILALLRSGDERTVFVFAEDCVAFCEPLDALDMLGAQLPILGSRDVWICEDGHHRGHGNGGLIILRGGKSAIDRIETILARCQISSSDSWTSSRWTHTELKGEHTVPHDRPINGCYPNLLFSAFGHAMPGVRAWAVSFNPHVLAPAQDAYSTLSVIAHLTRCLESGAPPFSAADGEAGSDPENELLEGRLSRVALVLVVLPGQEGLATTVERNMRLYATRHGYALYRFDADPGREQGHLATLLHHADQVPALHEQLLCLTADTLIHGLSEPFPGLMGQASVMMMRSPWGQGADIGMIALRKDVLGLDLLRIAGEEGSTGLEHRLARELAAGRIRLADLAALAPHTAFRHPASFLVRYAGLPDNVRGLLMREDAASIATRLEEPPPPPRTRTSLSWLRNARLNKWIMALVGISALVATIRQWR